MGSSRHRSYCLFSCFYLKIKVATALLFTGSQLVCNLSILTALTAKLNTGVRHSERSTDVERKNSK